jgi:hypothetical protein
MVLAALLLFLLCPVAALRDAITGTLQANDDLIATSLLVIALLLALGLVRIVFAVGRKLDAQADVAAIVRLENEHPVHVADVRQGRVQLIERSLALPGRAGSCRAQPIPEPRQYPPGGAHGGLPRCLPKPFPRWPIQRASARRSLSWAAGILRPHPQKHSPEEGS